MNRWSISFRPEGFSRDEEMAHGASGRHPSPRFDFTRPRLVH
jgi:hypothetical protein